MDGQNTYVIQIGEETFETPIVITYQLLMKQLEVMKALYLASNPNKEYSQPEYEEWAKINCGTIDFVKTYLCTLLKPFGFEMSDIEMGNFIMDNMTVPEINLLHCNFQKLKGEKFSDIYNPIPESFLDRMLRNE